MTSVRRRTAPAGLVVAGLALAAGVVLQQRVLGAGGVGPGRYHLLHLIVAWYAVSLTGAAGLYAARAGGPRVRRAALVLLAAGAVATTAQPLGHGSQISDDLYRYVWDGRAQLHGVDPYRYPPDAAQLRSLRTGWLWPDPATCLRLHKSERPCTRINRPSVRTVYPPVAEGAFAVMAALPAPPRDSRPQLYAGLLGLGLCGLLGEGLRRRGRDPIGVAVYAWSPLAGLDIAADAHVDVLAAVFGVAGLLLARRLARAGPRRAYRLDVVVGVVVGLAAAVKVYPLLLLPALLRREWRRAALASAAALLTVALSYLPHVLAVSTDVLGYLPGYLKEENYASGTRYLLVSQLGLDAGATQKLVVVLLAAAVVTAWRWRAEVEQRALLVLGAAFLLTTPVQPWYSLLLVGVAILAGRPEWIALTVAAYPAYFHALLREHPVPAGEAAYRDALVLIAAVTLARLLWPRMRRREQPATVHRAPTPVGATP